MKILIVSSCYYPSQSPRSFRTTELAQELSRQGHDVTVCIPKNGYDYTDYLKNHRINFAYINIPHSRVSIAKAGRLMALWNRIKARIEYTYLQYPDIYYLKELPIYLVSSGHFDAIISIAVPHPIHWGIAKAIRKFGKDSICNVWIADCGDPFMLCKTDSFRKPFYFKKFEKDFCRKADYITIPVKGGKDGYYPEFRPKIRVIPQGFDFSGIKTAAYAPNKVATFAYAGGFIPEIRDPRPILDFLCGCGHDFKFYVYTKQESLVTPFKDRLGDRLILSGYIDRVKLIYKMSTYDFLLNIENGTAVQTPSKLIDYALTKRPVLSLNSQNLDTGKFDRFLNGDYTQQLELPDIRNYDITNVAKSFITLIQSNIQ